MKRTKGSVIFIVIIFIAFISSLIFLYNIKINQNIDFLERENQKLEGWINCFSGYQYLSYLMITSKIEHGELKKGTGENYPNRIFLDGSVIKMPYNDIIEEEYRGKLDKVLGKEVAKREISLSLQDSAGLINPLRIRPDLFKNFLLNKEIEDDQAEILIDSLKDWVDGDDLKRLHGAEKDYYKREEAGYLPPNRMILSKDELFLIRGWDEKIVNKVKDFIDFQINTSSMNPNLMPSGAFNIFPGLNADEVNKISRDKKTNAIKKVDDLSQLSTFDFTPYADVLRNFNSPIIYLQAGFEMKDKKKYFIKAKLVLQGTEQEKGKIPTKKKNLKTIKRSELYIIGSWKEGIAAHDH